jgi:site-specific DNA-methyltransferase (adenine-specific)
MFQAMEVNKIYNEDCLDTMKKMPDEFIDLTVTSPPYDNLRAYKDEVGLNWNFEVFAPIADELYRVTKKNGVVVWVVGDATLQGTETGSSFRQALYFKDIGFNLHDTMIYEKNSSSFPASPKSSRYTQIFEYMFVFSKGKPKAKLLCDKKNKWAGWVDFGGNVLKDPVPEKSPRTNIWKYTTSFNGVEHPAPFPEKLATDHILTWSKEGDLVYDPFMGSGTTAKMAKRHKRSYIGSEISKEYWEICQKRLRDVQSLFDE